MLSSSALYKKEIRQNTSVTLSATINYADGTSETIDGSRIIQGTTSFDDSTSSTSDFEIGSAIINSFSTVLNNYDGHFDERDFTGATISVTIKKRLSDDTMELIPKGTYWIEQPSAYGSTISISANDKMHLFQRDFKDVQISYPTSVLSTVNAVCNYCGVVLTTQDFTNKDFQISEPEKDVDTTTCLDVISYMAQIAGCYARISSTGYLEFKWYETDKFSNDLDGGYFDNMDEDTYQSGDSADGGTFSFTDGDNYDGGNFDYSQEPYHIYALSSFEVSTDDVVITGIKTVVDGIEYMGGTDGYVLTVENNIFVNSSNAQTIVNSLSSKIVGMKFRPFNVSALGDATVEAGDSVYIIKGTNVYHSYITHCSFKIGSYESFECNAETPARKSATTYSATTKAVVQARAEAKKQISSYDAMMKQFESLVANSFGVYATEDIQEDGSVIYYFHDKSTLASSQVIWKMTANTFSVSKDGGQTWRAGIDADGNMILNVLSATGINADWIQSGTLTLGGELNVHGKLEIKDTNNATVGSWDNSGLSATSGYIANLKIDSTSISYTNSSNRKIFEINASGDTILSVGYSTDTDTYHHATISNLGYITAPKVSCDWGDFKYIKINNRNFSRTSLNAVMIKPTYSTAYAFSTSPTLVSGSTLGITGTYKYYYFPCFSSSVVSKSISYPSTTPTFATKYALIDITQD